MAQGLTIAGIDVKVYENSFIEQPLVYTGARVRTFDGYIYSTQANGMRVLECSAGFYSDAEWNALRAACPVGVAVTIAGELVVTSFQGVVDFQATTTKRAGAGLTQVLWRVCTLHIEQAIP